MKSVLLIGLGRFGRYMALRLNELGHEVLGVDCDEQCVNAALSYLTDAKICDATDEQVVRSLGVNNFDLCVVAIGEDFESSLEVTALLKDNGATTILARAATDLHERLLLRNGADHVIYPVKQAANYAATRYTTDHVLDYMTLSGDYSIVELEVPPSWIGQSIAELKVRERYALNIIAIREQKRTKAMPGPKYIFSPGESVMVMGHNDDLHRFLK